MLLEVPELYEDQSVALLQPVEVFFSLWSEEEDMKNLDISS
jgi:hypothetical protein